MIIEKENEEARHKALMEAYTDSEFKNSLEAIKSNLKTWLTQWANRLDPFDPRIPNVASIEARVKGNKSFEEKLYRKNYIKEWDVSDDKKTNQELIMRSLTDLIGLRVNCYFSVHEIDFYNYFLHTKSFQEKEGYQFNFDENKKQKNENIIYKFSGVYKDTCHFEVQIKSVVHNVWGEIEHRTVFKNPTYDSFYEEKKRISRTLHDTLMASDNELLILFNMKETEDQLLRSLFFCETNTGIAKECNTSVLGEHYNSYFLSFPDIEDIKRFLVCRLSGVEYDRKLVNPTDDDFYHVLSEAVKNTFPSFSLKCLFYIDSVLHIHSSYDSFLLYFLQNVIQRDSDGLDDEFSRDFNDQDVYPVKRQVMVNNHEDYLKRIDSILGTRVFKP